MEIRILLEALITERAGMIAENAGRDLRMESMAYGDEQFFALAEEMRALIKDAPEEREP